MSGCRKSFALAILATALTQSGCATADIAEPDHRSDEVGTTKVATDKGAAEKGAADKSATPPAPQRPRAGAETGTATWYGPGLEGRSTASGERFSSQDLTAAHKTLPFGTRVRVTALDTLASVVVTINDRLPTASRHIIDLSQGAGKMLKMIGAGITRVRIEIIE